MPIEKIVVLVVEDEPILRVFTVAELEDEGFDVLEAANAAEAIDKIERNPNVQLIFTDIDMPGTMDGLRLAAFVRDRWPPIRIIVTSGNHSPAASVLPEDAPFMGKPYDPKEVSRAIRRMIFA